MAFETQHMRKSEVFNTFSLWMLKISMCAKKEIGKIFFRVQMPGANFRFQDNLTMHWLTLITRTGQWRPVSAGFKLWAVEFKLLSNDNRPFQRANWPMAWWYLMVWFIPYRFMLLETFEWHITVQIKSFLSDNSLGNYLRVLTFWIHV